MRRPRLLIVSDGSATPETAALALPGLLHLRRRIRILRRLPGWMIPPEERERDTMGDSVHDIRRMNPIGDALPDCRVHIRAITAIAVSTSADDDAFAVRAPVSGTLRPERKDRLTHAASIVQAAIDACRSIIAGAPIIGDEEMDGAVREHCRILHRAFCPDTETNCRLTIASPWRQTLGLLPSDDARIVYGDLAHPLDDERIPVLDVRITEHEIVIHEVAGSLHPEHDDPMTRLRDAAAHAHLRSLVSPTPPVRGE